MARASGFSSAVSQKSFTLPIFLLPRRLRPVLQFRAMAYLVTGAQGCIGSWVVKNLIDAGQGVVVFDVDAQPRRLRQVMSKAEIGKIHFVEGDICDFDSLNRIIGEAGITHVIHLAALQVPACQANPRRGALVNVIGTLNVFEAVVNHSGQVNNIVYASSAAVAGPPDEYGGNAFTEQSALKPSTHYGVFKECNEGNASVYFSTRGISSIGLRPWAVYGVGRDFGLTSDPTKAIKAAVVGHPFQIQFGGRADMQYVDDVARIFIRCAQSRLEGARVYNLRGEALPVSEMVEAIARVVPASRGLITHKDQQLPIAPDFDDSALQAEIGDIPRTSFAAGVEQTVELFRRLQTEGRLPVEELGLAPAAGK